MRVPPAIDHRAGATKVTAHYLLVESSPRGYLRLHQSRGLQVSGQIKSLRLQMVLLSTPAAISAQMGLARHTVVLYFVAYAAKHSCTAAMFTHSMNLLRHYLLLVTI